MTRIEGRSVSASYKPDSNDPGLAKTYSTPAARACATTSSPPVPSTVQVESSVAEAGPSGELDPPSRCRVSGLRLSSMGCPSRLPHHAQYGFRLCRRYHSLQL